MTARHSTSDARKARGRKVARLALRCKQAPRYEAGAATNCKHSPSERRIKDEWVLGIPTIAVHG